MKTFRNLTSTLLILLLAISLLLSSCTDTRESKDTDKDKNQSTATTTAQTTADNENNKTPDTEKNAKELITSSFKKLSDAEYFKLEAVSEDTWVDENGEKEEDTYNSKIIVANIASPETIMIFSMIAEDSESYEFYSNGYDTYARIRFDLGEEGIEEYSYHRKTNEKMTFKRFMEDTSFGGNGYTMMILLTEPIYAGILGDVALAKNAAVVTDNDNVTSVTFTASLAELGGLFDYDVSEEDDIKITVCLKISENGYPLSFSFDSKQEYYENRYSCTCTEIKEKSSLIVPEWLEEVSKLPVSDYTYVTEDYEMYFEVNEDGSLTLEYIYMFSDEDIDYFKLPDEIEGQKITSIDGWAYAFYFISENGGVILPETVDVSDYEENEFRTCNFFTESERPEGFDHSNFYFKGEWEMKDGRPVATR